MKKSIFCFLFITFFFSQSQLFSQDEAWERIQPTPQEHSLYCVRQIPGTDRIVAVGGGSTIMYSDDDGDTWDIKLRPGGFNNFARFLAVNFFDETNGYVATDDGRILRTTDSGESWELIYNNQDHFLLTDRIDIYLKDAETAIVVGYDNLVLKTTNGGESWETSFTPEGFFPNSIDFVDDNTGYIVGRTDSALILKTVDGGNNWVAHPFNALNIPSYYDIYFINETEGIISGSDNGEVFIYKTFDAGDTWDTVFSSTIAYDIGEIDFKDELNGAINAYSWNTSFLYSTDGGETWLNELDNYFPGTSCYSFFYLPDLLIGVGNYGRIGRLASFGEEWESLSANTSFGLCRNAQFTSEQTGYSYFTIRSSGVPTGVLAKTENNGNTWSNILNGFYNGDFCFLNDSVGFIAGIYVTYDYISFKTEDGGINWEYIGHFYPDDNFDYRDPMVIDYLDEDNGLLAFTNKIYKTSQIGEYWHEIYSTNGWHEMTDIEYLSQDTFVITSFNYFANQPATLIWSYDGGNTLEFIPFESNLSIPKSIYFLDSLTAFIPFENYNTILKSIDGGHSWYNTLVNDTNSTSYKRIFFPSPDIGYAVGSGQYTTMLKTTDSGETWYPIDVPCTSTLAAVYFHDDWHGFVFGNNGVILETFTGGIVGLEENQFVASKTFFSLSPNPAKNTIQIFLKETSTNKLEIEVFNLNGIRVYHENSPGSKSEVLLNIENFPTGLYFCRVTRDSSVSTSRFLKL